MILQPQFALGGLGPVSGFNYYSPLTVQAGQVPSTQTDFPILINVTDSRFKTIGNGGHVQNANGYDIRPYSDSGITSALTYCLEFYDGTNGIVIMWVKIASLDDGNVTYLAYGNGTLNTDGSNGSSTFSNNFLASYPLIDGTTLSVNSFTGSNNGTNHGATATTGKIDGAAHFTAASSQYIDLGTGMRPTAVTLSAWVNADSFPNALNVVSSSNSASGLDSGYGIYVKSTGKLLCFINATTQLLYDGTGATTLSSVTWYYLTLTYDSSAGLISYVNASVDKTIAADGGMRTLTPTGNYIGQEPNGGGSFWDGKIDNLSISSVARAANWITTEYNNQSAPGTFMVLGTEA